MPNLLRKKRRASASIVESAAAHDAEEKHPLPQAESYLPPPSPTSSKTAVSRSSLLSFSSSRRRVSSESSSSSSINKKNHNLDGDAGSSSFKLSPMRSIAKKAKRQIQRLEDAVHHVTGSPNRPRGVHGRAVSEGTPPPSSEVTKPKTSLFPFSSPSRKRTLSTAVKGDSKKPFLIGKGGDDTPTAARSRTISLPIVLRRARSSDTMTSAESTTPHPLATSLQPVEEETRSAAPKESAAVNDDDVPDPFLVDEEGDALSSEEGSSPRPAANVPLSIPVSPSPLSGKPLPSPVNVNKEVPPPPVPERDDERSDEEDEGDDVPDLYLPGLVTPTMFLPIPNTDPLTILLNKYIYPPESRPHRDVSGEWQRSDFHTLVMTNSWRALARMARDRIVGADPADLNLILGLWHLRLSCLARLRLFNQTTAECTNLFTVLNNVQPPEARLYVFERLLPFELEVMQTRLKYWAGDHMGYLDSLAALLRKCKVSARAGASTKDSTTSAMWKERGARVVLIMASQMVEMKEFTAASRLLEPLCTNAALRSAIARIYLQSGNLAAASEHFRLVAEDDAADERQKLMNNAVLLSAEGNWAQATEVLKSLMEKDGEDFVAVNNLAVALLNQGKLKEAIEVLENALSSSPSAVVVAEPFLFNLSTLYELRSNIGFAKKRELLVEVAKWSGDGLKTTCLKLPAN